MRVGMMWWCWCAGMADEGAKHIGGGGNRCVVHKFVKDAFVAEKEQIGFRSPTRILIWVKFDPICGSGHGTNLFFLVPTKETVKVKFSTLPLLRQSLVHASSTYPHPVPHSLNVHRCHIVNTIHTLFSTMSMTMRPLPQAHWRGKRSGTRFPHYSFLFSNIMFLLAN